MNSNKSVTNYYYYYYYYYYGVTLQNLSIDYNKNEEEKCHAAVSNVTTIMLFLIM